MLPNDYTLELAEGFAAEAIEALYTCTFPRRFRGRISYMPSMRRFQLASDTGQPQLTYEAPLARRAALMAEQNTTLEIRPSGRGYYFRIGADSCEAADFARRVRMPQACKYYYYRHAER